MPLGGQLPKNLHLNANEIFVCGYQYQMIKGIFLHLYKKTDINIRIVISNPVYCDNKLYYFNVHTFDYLVIFSSKAKKWQNVGK